MRASAALVLFLLIAGCTAPPRQAGDGKPAALVAVRNDGTRDVEATLRVLSPTGVAEFEATLSVPAGGTVERRHMLASTGTYSVEATYRWSEEGRTASASGAEVFDTQACGPTARITFVVDASAGASTPRAEKACGA